jgi:uncharacterized protein YbjQ (UPF0145 family)
VIEAICSGCGSTFSVDDSHAGKIGRCRKCGVSVNIPSEPISTPTSGVSDLAAAQVEEEIDTSPPCQITTTDLIHGWSVTGYKGLVTAHVVAGTGFFSDFAAGWTDVFGGRSQTYQRQMAAIEEEALESLRHAAVERGANWVIGARIDFDEISGKGMQMFMVSAQGTAVNAVATPAETPDATTTLRVPGTAVRDQIRKDSIRRRLPAIESGEWPVTEDVLESLCDARLPEAVPLCIRIALSDEQSQSPRKKQLAKQALRLAPRHATRDELHEMMLQSQHAAIGAMELYRDLGLLDVRWVMQQISAPEKHARHVGLQVLSQCVATTYSDEDIPVLRALRTAVTKAFPETAREVDVKNLLGGHGRKWRCERGHDNALENQRCATCDIDRRGLPRGNYGPDIAVNVVESTLAILEPHFRPRGSG